jgi:hypothetical protein
MSALPETVIKYECGCTIARNFDGVKLTRCNMHNAAPELLEMLSDIAQELHVSSEMGGMTVKACGFYRDSIREFITKKLEE